MSKFTRRDLIHAGCTIAGASLVPHFMDAAEAGMNHGIATVTPSGLSQRSVLNMGFAGADNSFAFINHFLTGQGTLNEFGSPFLGTTPTWMGIIDSTGWPADPFANGKAFGGGYWLPDPNDFNGDYVLDWDGDGTVLIANAFNPHTWSETSLTNATRNSNGSYSNTAGLKPRIVVKITSGGGSGPLLMGWSVNATDPHSTGRYVKNVRFYRTGQDETDLNNGLIYRAAYKQQLVDLNPGAIRFMNWTGGNNSRNCRFENRTLPTLAGWGPGCNFVVSPVYGTTTKTGLAFSLAAATGTTLNPKTTPVASTHGEIATFTFGSDMSVRPVTVSTFTNANPGTITTSSPHGFITGDSVEHAFVGVAFINYSPMTITVLNSTQYTIPFDTTTWGAFVSGTCFISPKSRTVTAITKTNPGQVTATNHGFQTGDIAVMSGNGLLNSMPNLYNFPVTVTRVDANNFTIGVDTSSFSTLSGACIVCRYVTLNIGARGDFPLSFPDGGTPYTLFGAGYVQPKQVMTAYFCKNSSLKSDGAGNPIFGAWMISAFPSNFNQNGHGGGIPIEACTALVNELNAMSAAQGITNLIGMWMNIPAWGMCSIDPDYSTSSDWTLNAVDVVMNPSSSVRTSGYSALGYSGATQLNSPPLIVEHGNEEWNGGINDAFGWAINAGIARYGQPFYASSNGNEIDIVALRGVAGCRTVKAANPSYLSRVKFVLGCEGQFGLSTSGFDGAGNHGKIFGGSVGTPVRAGDFYQNDPIVTSSSWGRPIDNVDGCCFAGYINPTGNYMSKLVGVGSFTDDAAMFNGTDNSASSISWNATIATVGSVSTMTVTGSVTGGTINIGQLFNVAGGATGVQVTLRGTGTGGAGTYTVTTTTAVPSSTVMSNVGVNYTGAANQSQAVTNFVNNCIDAANLYPGDQTLYRYTNLASTGGSYSIAMATIPGKIVTQYEGGVNWIYGSSAANGGFTEGGRTVSTAEGLLLIAAYSSAQWGAAQVAGFNTLCLQSNVFLPSIYVEGPQRWGYYNPTPYASGIEGQALVNNLAWGALGTRNRALPN